MQATGTGFKWALKIPNPPMSLRQYNAAWAISIYEQYNREQYEATKIDPAQIRFWRTGFMNISKMAGGRKSK